MGSKKKGAKTKTLISAYEAAGDKAFYMMNGKVVTKLIDLANTIENTDDNTFGYHVNAQKNDFASWIGGVFKAKQLAKKVSSTKNKQELVSILKTQVK